MMEEAAQTAPGSGFSVLWINHIGGRGPQWVLLTHFLNIYT